MGNKKNNIGFELFRANIRDYYRRTFAILHGNNKEEKENLLRIIESNDTLRNKFFLAYQSRKIHDLGINRLFYNNAIESYNMLRLSARIIDICNEQVNSYLRLRKEYEKWLVTNDYEKAWAELKNIEETVGFSIWGLSQKLLLAELKGGIKSSAEVLKIIVDNVAQNDSLLFLLVHYKDLVDFDLSYSQFQHGLDNHLKGSSNEVTKYMESKLKIDKQIVESDFSLILQIDLQFSIIDLFTSYEKILLSEAERIFHDNETDYIRSILPHKTVISSIIDITNVLIGKKSLQTRSVTIDTYLILDMYTRGEYARTVKACIEYLSTVPQDFQITCIYCKSLLHQQILHEGEWPSEYSKAVYSIYAMDEDIKISAQYLLKGIRLFHGIGLSIKIRSFLERKNIIEGDNAFYLSSFLLDEIANPNMLKQVDDSRIPLLKEFFSEYSNESLAAMEGVISGNEDIIPEGSDGIRNLMMHIQCNCVNKDFDSAYANLRKLNTLDVRNNLYIWERVLQITLLYYKEAYDYLGAVHLLVDSYFENKSLFRRVLNKNRFKTQYRCKDSKVIRDINHMILTYLIHPTQYNEQIIVYNNLLDSNGITDITECVKQIKGSEKDKWIFFLKEICSVDLLRMDDRLYIKGIAPERARYTILDILSSQYRVKNCTEEMFEIRKMESVQDKLKTIQNGRITTDTERIFQINQDKWEGMFNRFLSVPREESVLYYVEFSDRGIQFSNEMGKQSPLIVRSSTQIEHKRRIITDLIKSIVYELLFNESYGLETFLSTRIRHGYSKGQLISFLQNADLVATYDEDNNLIISDHWNKSVNKAEYQVIKELIVSLTKKIEKKITEILSEWLRIKLSKEEKGMFDYVVFLSDEALDIYLSHMDDHYDLNQLYREVVDAYWDCTDRILESIRERIDNELNSYYIQSIDDMIAGIPQYQNDFATNNPYQDLNSRCQRVKAETNLVLHQYKEAFIRMNTGYQDFTMDELAECVYKMLRQQLEAGVDNWKVNTNNSCTIKGQYFLAFVDVFGILGSNAISHSGIQDKSKIKISCVLNLINKNDLNEEAIEECPELRNHEKYVLISVTNNLFNRLNEDTVERKLKKVFNQITENGTTKKLLQKEGGSGLIKLCNIIESQINRLYYTEYSVENHNVTISCVICADTLVKEVVNEGIVN